MNHEKTKRRVQSLVVSLIALLLFAVPAGSAQEVGGETQTTLPSKLGIRILEGDGPTVTLKKRLIRPVIVQVEDENRKPVAGVTVSFRLLSNAASFTNGQEAFTVVTGPNGQAVLHSKDIALKSTGKLQIRVEVSQVGQPGVAPVQVPTATAQAGVAPAQAPAATAQAAAAPGQAATAPVQAAAAPVQAATAPVQAVAAPVQAAAGAAQAVTPAAAAGATAQVAAVVPVIATQTVVTGTILGLAPPIFAAAVVVPAVAAGTTVAVTQASSSEPETPQQPRRVRIGVGGGTPVIGPPR